MSLKAAVFLSGALLSGSLGATSLPKLISTSDAIVAGTESAAAQTDNRTVIFNLHVERVFTGEIPVGATVDVVWHARVLGLPDGSPTYRGIWFLRKAPDGSWECTSAGAEGNAEFFPDLSLPLSTGPLPPPLAYDAGATPLPDQLILEMAAGTPRANPMMILYVISGMNSPAKLRAFRYLAGSRSHDQAIVGLTGLIYAGDTAGLLSAEALSSGLTSGVNGADGIASAIKLAFRSTDPVAVAALGRMATSGKASRPMQDAAAFALSAIHSSAAVPWLGLLLDNPSEEMQSYGARGLSSFANGVGIPTAQTMPRLDHLNQRQQSSYRTPETDQHIGFETGQPGPFIEFWRTWWWRHPELQALPAQ